MTTERDRRRLCYHHIVNSRLLSILRFPGVTMLALFFVCSGMAAGDGSFPGALVELADKEGHRIPRLEASGIYYYRGRHGHPQPTPRYAACISWRLELEVSTKS